MGMFWQLHPFHWLYRRNKPKTQLTHFFLCFNPGLFSMNTPIGLASLQKSFFCQRLRIISLTKPLWYFFVILAKISSFFLIFRLAWCQWSVRQICNSLTEEDDYIPSVTQIYLNISILGTEYWIFEYKYSIFWIRIYLIIKVGQIIRNEYVL